MDREYEAETISEVASKLVFRSLQGEAATVQSGGVTILRFVPSQESHVPASELPEIPGHVPSAEDWTFFSGSRDD